MNGIHDLGGMTGFGPVQREPAEPVFHAAWERQVFGLVRTTVDARYNWDEFRFAIERLDPVVYLSSSYYERWLSALERYLMEKGVVTEAELRTRTDGAAPRPGLANPGPEARWHDSMEVGGQPPYQPGDAVRARTVNPTGHTRLPRYVRGKRGTIARILGSFIVPDDHALGTGERREPVYAVRFAARELWGEGAHARDSVCVDLWQSYLRPAREGEAA